MCCELPSETIEPPAIAAVLSRYVRERATGTADFPPDLPYGATVLSLLRFGAFEEIVPELATFAPPSAPFNRNTFDWAGALRALLPRRPLLRGLLHVKVDEGRRVTVASGPPAYLVPGGESELTVLIDSSATEDVDVRCGEVRLKVAAGAAAFFPAFVTHAEPDLHMWVAEREVVVRKAARPAAVARLTVHADDWSRWRVEDDGGGGWWPPDRLRKLDFHESPFFHAREASLDVPAGVTLTVRAGRGLEFAEAEAKVTLEPDDEASVELLPRRLVDPAAMGWYGGDLHVHLNYGGEVCSPHDAVCMQRGEALHVMNLVAANMGTATVFDKEMLQMYAGEDLPWSDGQTVARMGVEYRNDLLGHFHATNPHQPPARYQSGHPQSDNKADWPPNAAACEELRGLGAAIGYTHPTFFPFDDDGGPGKMLEDYPFRAPDARELVADAALGLVDTIDLVSNAHPDGATSLYHRLLNCGIRLAVSAGTDSMLSRTVCGVLSNPPGWGRVYARVGRGELTFERWTAALRRGETVATNGPWLQLDVGGHGPGAVIDADYGDEIMITASASGLGAGAVEVVGPDGVIDRASRSGAVAVAHATITVHEPTWVAAVAKGEPHPEVLDRFPFAHTTPVHIQLAGRRIGRASDARWCLDYLERFEALVRAVGTFERPEQLEDLLVILHRAREVYRRVAEGAPIQT